jgi:hypothetical protein
VSTSRLIYAKNDPELRGIMGELLASQPELDVFLSSVSPTDVLTVGGNVLNGIDVRIGCLFVPKTQDVKIQDLLAPAGDAQSVFVHLVSPSVRTPTHRVTPPMMGSQ